MKVVGHETRSIFERYKIKIEDDLREAALMVSEMIPIAPATAEKP